MTLVWATSVIDRDRQQEQEKQQKERDVRQACRELDELFRARTVRGRGSELVLSPRGDVAGYRPGEVEKSFGDHWSLAFKPDGEH